MDRVPKAHGVDFKVWADRLAVIMMLMVLAWCLAGLMMPARAQSDPRSDAGGGIYRPAGRYVVGVRCAYYA